MGDPLTLRNLLEPPVEALGYELLYLELAAHGGDNVLRVYIDAPGGIQVDDCVAVSRQLSALLDVEDPLKSAYQLEVSSPGLDRPLVKPEHFRRFVGSRARIVMNAGVMNVGVMNIGASSEHRRRRFSGELLEADARRVVIEVDGERYELAYHDMNMARLEPVF